MQHLMDQPYGQNPHKALKIYSANNDSLPQNSLKLSYDSKLQTLLLK